MIALVEVSPHFRHALARASLETVDCTSANALHAASRSDHALDAVVIGADALDPIQGAAQAYRLDPSMSVVILGADDAQCARIRRALTFAPLVGTDVTCSAKSPTNVVSVISEAASRTRARRKHKQALAAIDLQLATPSTSIASERSLVAREHYAGQLMAVAPIAMLALDPGRRIVMANHEAARLLGLSERDMLGLVLGSEALGKDGGAWDALLSAAGHEPREAVTVVRGGDASQTIEARAVTIWESAGGGFLVVFQDVSARVGAEKQMREAYEKAETASRLKDEFLAVTSHELRTPLNAIIGWMTLLRRGQVSAEKLDGVLATVERNAQAQARLVADLLDVSTIATGKMRIEVAPLQMSAVVDDALESLAPAATARKITIRRHVGGAVPELTGDAERLRQVAWNLLGNAIKFTPIGGTVDVELRVVDSLVELVVRDSGIGIPPEAVPFIFDPFRQAEGGTTRAFGGLGLGLSIARRIVEIHGGTVTAASAGAGKGSEFVVRIPVHAAIV